MELSSEVNWSDASQKSEAQMHHLKVINVKHMMIDDELSDPIEQESIAN